MIPRPELALLVQSLDEVIANGKGTTIFIVGDPGIGKSTLVDNFLYECGRYEANILTATGRCIDIDGVMRGYLPWKEVLIELDADRAAGKDVEKKQSFTAIIKTLFDESGSEWIQNIPYIGDISAAILSTAQAIQRVEEIDASSGETRDLSFRERLRHVLKECTGSWMGAIPFVGGLAEAIYTTSRSLAKQQRGAAMRNQEDFFILVMTRLRALSKDSPVVVFLDDLQWADASSLSLLLYLSKNLHDLPYPLLLIGSYRAEDVGRGRRNTQTGEIERHPLEEKINVLMRYNACREITLGSFDRSQLEAYVHQRFPQQSFNARFIGELEHVSGGNVLFVQEMLTNMMERGIIAEQEGIWRLTAEPEYSHLPRTIEGVIKERYERLAVELKEMLQVAAVEGEQFSFEVLEMILQENRLVLNRHIDRLMNKHALVHRSAKLSQQVMRLYEFTHNLVQKYIYYSMEEDFRREVHRMIAGTLKELLDEDGINRWAQEYSLHLGIGEGIINEHRRIVFDKPSASRQGVEAMGEYLRLQKALVEQYSDGYKNEEAIAGCDHVIALMQLNGDDAQTQLEYSRRKVKLLELIGRWKEAEELYRQQLTTLREAGDRNSQAQVLTSLADLIRRLGRIDEAERTHREGEQIAREMNDPAAIARAVGYRGLLHWRCRQYKEALECYREQEDIARGLGDLSHVSMALANRGNVYAGFGEFDKALACYNEAEQIARGLGDRLGMASDIGNRGTIFSDLGQFDKALECFREEEQIEREAGFRKGIAHAVGNRGTVHLNRREYDEALKCFREAAQIHREIGFRYSLTSWLAELAHTIMEVAAIEEYLPAYLPAYVPALDAQADSHSDQWRAMSIRQARNYAEECLAISEELSKQSTIFRSHVLLARIASAESGSDGVLHCLRDLLEQAINDDQRAELHYWLWKLGSDDDGHRARALSLYRALVATMPIYEYSERINELQGRSE